MEWSKIKNIIILILVCLNVLLLAVVILREGGNARNLEETREGVVTLLEKNQISFRVEKVPADLTLSPLSVTRSRETEQAMASSLLGPVERESAGGSVRVVYTSSAGTATFSSDGRFDFSLNTGTHPVEDGNLSRDSSACLDLLGLQAVWAETRSEGGDTLFVYYQTWESVPLFSCPITLTYRDNALLRVEGVQLTGTAVTDTGNALDTPTVLLRFLAGMNDSGYICSRIDAMTAGYQSSASAVRPVVQLTPAWQISTDTGIYYVDALTGELTLAE